MKECELPADEAIERLIHARYGDAFDIVSDNPVIHAGRLSGTKPPSPILREALFAVNDARAKGARITEALKFVYDKFDLLKQSNSTLESFTRTYQKFRRNDLYDHFASCILYGDMNDAVLTVRMCSDQTRRLIWDDLTRDLPPRASP